MKRICKAFKKNFSCNGAVQKDDEAGEVRKAGWGEGRLERSNKGMPTQLFKETLDCPRYINSAIQEELFPALASLLANPAFRHN